MNSPVKLSEVSYERKQELRRKTTLSNMRCTLQAQSLELERIKTLGDAEAAKALQHFRDRLAHLILTAGSLQEDFEDLAEADVEFTDEDDE